VRPTVLQTEEPTPAAPTGAPALGYVAALDGLRALAVGAVLLYHAGVGWMSAGYLGVDLFFVLSGFLITRLLLDEWASTGRIDLLQFWRRRAARLLPAVLVLLALCPLVFRDRSRLGGDVLATAGYVANWRLIVADVPYFQRFEAPSPLLHTWSLAIEEQWYVVWPIVVALGAVLLRTRRGRIVASAAVVGALLTSALLMRAFSDDTTRAYYGTDTRVQALLAGVVVALVVAPQAWAMRVRATTTCAVVGLLGLAWLAVVVEGAPRWMLGGGFTLAAACGALAVAGVASGAGVVGQVLSMRGFVAVGRLSYSLYLWHWPVYLWLTPDRTDLHGNALIVVRIAVSLAVALASFALVEQPIRLKRAFRPVVVLAAALVPVVAIGIVRLDEPVGAELDGEERVGAIISSPTTTASTSPTATSTAEAAVEPPDAAPTTTTAPPAPPRIVLFGDSQAISLDHTLALEPGAFGFPVTFLRVAEGGCGIIGGFADVGEGSGQNDNCEYWQSELPPVIAELDPDVVVVMIGAWEVYDTIIEDDRLVPGTPEYAAQLESRLREVDAIASSGGAQVVLLDVACFPVPEFGLGEDRSRADPDRVQAVNDALGAAAAELDLEVLPYHDLLCDGNEPRSMFGVVVRPDGVHFPMDEGQTSPGALFVLHWLGEELQRLGIVPAP
jgi:peptidoglycan/LPS O-acetylase OafA/YrhL/lysophospholipase L1-like esterase